jgi:hypothetical protein
VRLTRYTTLMISHAEMSRPFSSQIRRPRYMESRTDSGKRVNTLHFVSKCSYSCCASRTWTNGATSRPIYTGKLTSRQGTSRQNSKSRSQGFLVCVVIFLTPELQQNRILHPLKIRIQAMGYGRSFAGPSDVRRTCGRRSTCHVPIRCYSSDR